MIKREDIEKSLKEYDFLEFPGSLPRSLSGDFTWGINPELSNRDLWPADIELKILKCFEEIEPKITFDLAGKNQKLISGEIYTMDFFDEDPLAARTNTFNWIKNEYNFQETPSLFLGYKIYAELATHFLLESEDHSNVFHYKHGIPVDAQYKKICLYQTANWSINSQWYHFGNLFSLNFLLGDSTWKDYFPTSKKTKYELPICFLNFPTQSMTHDVDQISGFKVDTHDLNFNLIPGLKSIPRMDQKTLIKVVKKYPRDPNKFNLINKNKFEKKIKLNNEIQIYFRKNIFINGEKIILI